MRPTAVARGVTAALLALATFSVARPAHAEREWVHRDLVLPRGEVALDIGLGIGHAPLPFGGSESGLGLNLELHAGLARDVELGIRTGFRLNTGGQDTQADSYGRPFDTETYGTAFDRVANPELYARWGIARGPNAALGFELRAILPFETGSRFGMVLGLPVVLRTGILRIDTGIYVPILFYDPTVSALSVPFHLWIQASPSLWLGPLFGIRVYTHGGGTEYPVGIGLGTMLAWNVDLRFWFLFPNVDYNEYYGGGVALQIRF